MNEIFIASLIVAGSIAVTFIGYHFLRALGEEDRTFARNHVEDAMRIKARQYENGNA